MKLVDAEPHVPPTKLRKAVEQRKSTFDKSMISAKNGEHHAKLPEEGLESLALKRQDNLYSTILHNLYQSSVTPPTQNLYVRNKLCARCAKIDLDTIPIPATQNPSWSARWSDI